MRWLGRLRLRMRMLFRRGAAEFRLDDELRFHLDRQIDENIANGMSADEARRAALRLFGNPALLRDQAHATWSWLWLESLGQDLRYAVRSLWRSRSFAATVIVTLALGIGAAAAMFTVVDHVLLRRLPFQDAGRLALIHEGDRTGKSSWDVPWLDVEEWSKRSKSFEQFAVAGTMGGRNYIEGKSAAVQIEGIDVSSNLFGVLKANPMLGRTFDPEPPSFGGGRNRGTIVLSYPVWQTAFGADAGVIGKVASVNGKPFTIVGVMPRGFFFPRRGSGVEQVWLPLELGAHDKERDYNSASYEAVGRLRGGVTIEA